MSKKRSTTTSSSNLEGEPLVSVLTPVYDGEKYLTECIESVLAQTYQNWEYIIVNNCSGDRTLELARKYAEKDPRIRIHNNSEFVGLIENHNIAFRQNSPQSKYCKMVHADDWLFPDCIAQMVEVAGANPSVGIVGAYRLEEDKVRMDGLPYPSTVVSGRKIFRSCLLDGLRVFGTPTSLLYRSDIVRGREGFFNESNPHADTEICYEILQKWDYGFVHQVLTFTRKHAESATSFATQLDTDSLNWHLIVTKYGRTHLSSEEYAERLREAVVDYYRMLGKSVLKFRGNGFWAYHRKALADLGFSLSWMKLAKAVFLVLFDLLLNPKNTLGKALQDHSQEQKRA